MRLSQPNRVGRGRRLVEVTRGLFVEAMGVAVLLFLFLAIRGSASTTAEEVDVSRRQPGSMSAMGVAVTNQRWLPFLRRSQESQLESESNRPLPMGGASWTTWYPSSHSVSREK